jgi:hypothetical protein
MIEFLKNAGVAALVFLVIWPLVELTYDAIDTDLTNRSTSAEKAQAWAAQNGRGGK